MFKKNKVSKDEFKPTERVFDDTIPVSIICKQTTEIKSLIENGLIDINYRMKNDYHNGYNILMEMTWHAVDGDSFDLFDKEFADYLITNGIDINAQDNNGNTCLMNLFVKNNHYFKDTIKKLILNGADTHIKNNRGKSVFEIESSIHDDSDIENLIKLDKNPEEFKNLPLDFFDENKEMLLCSINVIKCKLKSLEPTKASFDYVEFIVGLINETIETKTKQALELLDQQEPFNNKIEEMFDEIKL